MAKETEDQKQDRKDAAADAKQAAADAKDDELKWVRSSHKLPNGISQDKPVNGDRIVLLETDLRHPTLDGQVHVAGDMKVQVFPTALVHQKLREGVIEECDPPKKGDTVLGGNDLHVGGNPNQPLASEAKK